MGFVPGKAGPLFRNSFRAHNGCPATLDPSTTLPQLQRYDRILLPNETVVGM